MKSVMEAAPSLQKAIENGWERAGRPQEFTVKILQEPIKGFLGFGSEPAKIALLFDEKIIKKEKTNFKQPAPQKKSAPVQKATEPSRSPAPQKPALKRIWTDDRITFAEKWVKDMLVTMKRSDITFKSSIDRTAIRFAFNKQILATEDKEKQLFRSWAYLLTQTMRHNYKQHFKNIKIILKSS